MLSQSLAISCLVNPRAGKEAEWPRPMLAKVDTKRPVLVVGAGPAGMEAAGIAAERFLQRLQIANRYWVAR